MSIAFGVLAVSVLAAAVITRRTAESSTLDDLRARSPKFAAELASLHDLFPAAASRPAGAQASRFCRFVSDLLEVSGGSVVTASLDGTVDAGVGDVFGVSCPTAKTSLPGDLPTSRLDAYTLLDGHRQSGVSNGRAFVAEPVEVRPSARPVLQPVLVLTQKVDTRPLGRGGGLLIIAGAIALAVAAVVAAYLARRMTRPLAAVEAATGRIAAGDLAARVDTTGLSDDELMSLSRAFNAMARDLETARSHERAFLLSISHDLRTPLTSIKGYATAIADGTVEGRDNRVNAAHVIEREAERLERLVADLLDLARLDAHQFTLSPRPIDAREVVDNAVEGFLPSARDWGITLGVTNGGPVAADADPERLAQIVANLVENALKYATATVTVDVARRDGSVELRVDDDGPGIPADERGRVFERLYTARHAPGRTVGTGIGLAIVRELAGAMGGDADCRALESGGTRFVVRIPAGRN